MILNLLLNIVKKSVIIFNVIFTNLNFKKIEGIYVTNKERKVGTVSRGIRCPIIRKGDDLAAIVTNSVLEAAECEGFELRDRDVISITESIVARAQGNYASVNDIAADVKAKLGGETVGVIFPILSRNRFAICLKGIAMASKKIVLMLSYPSDEVGNELISIDQIDAAGINPYSDVLSLERYRELFGYNKHEFTGVDYVEYYGNLIRECGAEVEIIFANQAKAILNYTDCIINCDIHTRARTKRILKEAGAKVVCSLDDILNASVSGSGYNEKYGLLGSNKSTEDTIKLFPKECQDLVLDIQKKVLDRTGKHVEVMVYGDGAFKDPKGKIWELADPVVSPAFTDGLIGTPNELKLKYLADNDFKDLSGEELKKAISESIKAKQDNLVGNMASQGTTPRQLTDLIGSLCDLTSGSGDKGTPVVLVQGYFDNYTN
ncbi:MAG: coenzyme F420-0:L-glutamate ligase [Clostridia bacterium]|nr:coenzyme F420-0:L-glutamate ligase [Clostridia bacterium]